MEEKSKQELYNAFQKWKDTTDPDKMFNDAVNNINEGFKHLIHDDNKEFIKMFFLIGWATANAQHEAIHDYTGIEDEKRRDLQAYASSLACMKKISTPMIMSEAQKLIHKYGSK